MAAVVLRDGGTRRTRSCCEVKRLVDPDSILNPGVLLNDDRAFISLI